MKIHHSVALLVTITCAVTLQALPAGEKRLDTTVVDSPLAFIENRGQVSDQNYQARMDVLFSGQTGGMVFHLRNNGISYQLYKFDAIARTKSCKETSALPEELIQDVKVESYRIDLTWLNFNPGYTIEKDLPLPGYCNYYLVTCPQGVTHVKSYSGVTYKNLYNNIDLHYYISNGQLKYDFEVGAGSDYTQIRMQLKGVELVYINKHGDLVLSTPFGEIVEHAPIVYQNGKVLQSRWLVIGNEARFEIENINHNFPYTIDPGVRVWGTYYGGNDADASYSCTVDSYGNIYKAGTAQSVTLIATSGAYQATYSGGSANAMLVKFSTSGTRIWGTYYGGNGRTEGYSCANDQGGNVFLSGNTNASTAIATLGAYQTMLSGGNDDYLVKFDSSGVRIWGTYFGGNNGEDGGSGTGRSGYCAVDISGNVYLCGTTQSNTGIATPGSHQPTFGGGSRDAFLAKFSPNGSLSWASYYGGASSDEGVTCTCDGQGNIYLSGTTNCVTVGVISTAGVWQSAIGGNGDAFLVKFSPGGVRLWGSYFGGTSNDKAGDCVTDQAGNVYLVGVTRSNSGISSVSAYQTSYGGNDDGYVVKFTPNGNRVWGTYFGGTGYDELISCSVDAFGYFYASGMTESSTGIATSGVQQTAYGGNDDAVLLAMDSTGGLIWATYYGGGSNELGYGCTGNNTGEVYMCGSTNSNANISSVGSHQTTRGGGSDGFLAKFADLVVLPIELIQFGGTCSNGIATLSWITATETDNSHFTVYRSDGVNESQIGTVSGAGNSSTILTYQFNDTLDEITPGFLYYRLMQTDYNGTTEYFSWISLEICEQNYSGLNFSIYPNPVSQSLIISGTKEGEYVIRIWSTLGENVFIATTILGPVPQTILLPELAAGTYFIQIENNTEILFEDELIILNSE